ncbi:MAG: nickel insertion protein [Clostridiaceae bacterium]
MKLYMDCTSGVSGNMIIGAFLNLGMPIEYLEENILKLVDPKSFKIIVNKRNFFGTDVTYFNTIVHSEAEADGELKANRMNAVKALDLLENSHLSPSVAEYAYKILSSLIDSKAAAHGCERDMVDFNYEGFSDTLIDILGACLGMEYFHVKEVISSPLQVGTGKIKLKHCEIDIPSPMTKILLEGKPYYSTTLQGELVTPTGAAIVTGFASSYTLQKEVDLCRIGFGLATESSGLDGLLKLYLSHK